MALCRNILCVDCLPSSFGLWSGAAAGMFCVSQGTLHQSCSVGTAGGEVGTGQGSWSTLAEDNLVGWLMMKSMQALDLGAFCIGGTLFYSWS